MKPPNPVQTQYIYFPYKIHKNPITVRPVVAGINGATTNISKYIDHYFKNIVPLAPSHLKNSQALINILSKTTIPPSEQVLLVSIDVKSLYTTIPQEQGINALLQYNEIIGLPKHVTRQLLNFVLKNNTFTFNGQPYHQLTGVAMGTPLAPTLANIFMSSLEESFLSTQDKRPHTYKRYIDDIFMIWTHSRADLDTFLTNLNNHHPTIKFEWNISDTAIDYRDLTIYKDTNFERTKKLSYKTHLKPTNSFQYIHYTSHHPHHRKTAIIKAELLRYQKQCSDPKQFAKLKQQLIEHFLNRGYAFKRINQVIQALSSQPKITQKKKIYPLIIEYYARQQHTRPHLQQHIDILQREATTFPLSLNKPITAYKIFPNLKKIITRSPLDTDIKKTGLQPSDKSYSIPLLPTKCNRRDCLVCPMLIEANAFRSTTTNEKIHIRSRLTCSSMNIIYILQCKTCKLQYVGQTTRSLRERMSQHRSSFRSTRQPRMLLYKHFDTHGTFNAQIIPLTHTHPSQRMAVEQWWINKLRTRTPEGLNDIYL